MANGCDVIVIGSGIAGLTAARSLARHGLAVANLEGGLFGGLVTNVNELDGEFTGSGADLASTLMMEVADLGCAAIPESVTGLASDAGGVVVSTDAGTHRARAVIIATGAKLRRLGVPGEAELEYKGVSQCADCDGPMFQGQDVVVVGGGDSALQEALVLSHYCASVRIIHHGPAFTARAHWVAALHGRDNVTAMPNAEVEAIEGRDAVQGVRVRSRDDGTTRTLACTGIFAYIGLTPSAGFVPPEIARDTNGALVVDANLATGLPHVWAAGAVRAGFGGTLADAVRDAGIATAAVLQHLR